MELVYDYIGRRVEKKVYDWLGPDPDDWSATPSLVRRFVWTGWLMLMELDGSNNPVRKYTWGLDLAGLMGGAGVSPVNLESAGGIGGLLAVEDANGTPGNPGDDLRYVYLYDANGNVGQVVDIASAAGWSDTRMVAKYEYDPYGNVSAQTGPYAATNPFRFSTKYWDDETGLGYWGYRYYSPRLGRWISRDPIGYRGGPNLFTYVANEPVAGHDVLGLWGDGRRVLEIKIAQVERNFGELAKAIGTWEAWDLLQSLRDQLARTPLGHSDFVGYPEFDWTAEDHDPATSPLRFPQGTRRHFRSMLEVAGDLQKAIGKCNKSDFERAMHQGQDVFAHYDQGWRTWSGGHLWGGHDPDDGDKYRSAWEQANFWTQRNLDRWYKECCKNEKGEWQRKPCCCTFRGTTDTARGPAN